MELACDIIRENKKYYECKCTAISSFKKLNLCTLSKKYESKKFINKINEELYLKTANNLISFLFENKNEDIGFSLLMVYYITAYKNSIFIPIKTNFDIKLIEAAYSVMQCIDQLFDTNNNLTSEFNNYYSMYKTWTSKEPLNKINAIFDQIHDQIIAHTVKKMSYPNKVIPCLMNKMILIDDSFAIQLLLNNYNILNKVTSMDILWEKVKQQFPQKRNIIVLMLIAELRIKLLSILKTSSDKKDIYYNIDIENIINDMATHHFTPSKLNYLIKLLSSKLNISHDITDIAWSPEYYNKVIKSFRIMYDYSG